MKQAVFLALVQAAVMFVVIGLITYFTKGDFFYHFLALIFALAAGGLRFLTANLMDWVQLKGQDKKD